MLPLFSFHDSLARPLKDTLQVCSKFRSCKRCNYTSNSCSPHVVPNIHLI